MWARRHTITNRELFKTVFALRWQIDDGEMIEIFWNRKLTRESKHFFYHSIKANCWKAFCFVVYFESETHFSVARASAYRKKPQIIVIRVRFLFFFFSFFSRASSIKILRSLKNYQQKTNRKEIKREVNRSKKRLWYKTCCIWKCGISQESLTWSDFYFRFSSSRFFLLWIKAVSQTFQIFVLWWLSDNYPRFELYESCVHELHR